MRITEGQLRRIIKEELQSEISIRMSHAPDDLGAYIDDEEGVDDLPIVNLPVDRVSGFEPDAKMDIPKHRKRMLRMVRTIKDDGSDSMPPILVRPDPTRPDRWQVIDGHHRLHAHRLAGERTIKARVIPDESITDISA